MLDCGSGCRTACVPARHILKTSAILLAATACAASDSDTQAAPDGMTVTRFAGNPLITQASSPGLDECAPKYRRDYPDCPSINGPSVIRVPEWVENPLGRYYMYFANHVGDYIRLAYADSPLGPWTVHEPGTLRLDQIRDLFWDHIASPDVHVDEQRQRILMYFHAPLAGSESQKTAAAVSEDGIRFTPASAVLGRYYFRVFEWRERFFAIAKLDNTRWGELYEADSPLGPFSSVGPFIRDMRHAAVYRCGDRLYVFYTRVGDAPERILATEVELNTDPQSWLAGPPDTVLAPQRDYEGARQPVRSSQGGGSYAPEHALRDPYVFEDDGRLYLYYAIAGEQGIAGARLEIARAMQCTDRH